MSRITLSTCFLFALATPAFAQDYCGGAGENGQWIGGDEAASDIATAETFQEQMALVLSGNRHVSLFSLSAPADVRVEAAGRGNGDPAFDLYDESGSIVVSDDDSGGNGAARAELSLDPGTYCLSMESYTGAPMTAFVRIARQEHEALTAGMSETVETATDTMPAADCADAPSLGTLDGPLTATGSVDEVPVWRFTLAAETPVTITAENEAADTVITLRDEAETVLGENDDHNGLNSQLDFAGGLPAGDYCLQVGALDDTSLPIDVAVSVYDPEAAIAALYASGEAAPPLDGDIPVTDLGALSTRLRQDQQVTNEADWFYFEVAEVGVVLIEALGVGGEGVDPWIALYDDLGRQIDFNDDSAGGLDSMIAARVNAGGYMLAVKQLGDGQGMVRVLMERFVPAQ